MLKYSLSRINKLRNREILWFKIFFPGGGRVLYIHGCPGLSHFINKPALNSENHPPLPPKCLD